MNKKLEPCQSLSELMCNNPCACCSVLAEEGRIVPICSTCKVTMMRKELERRAAPKANEALTLEELRGMDGEPVWAVLTPMRSWEPKGACWIIVTWDCVDRLAHSRIGNLFSSDYGKEWIAYRRPPEGGEG